MSSNKRVYRNISTMDVQTKAGNIGVRHDPQRCMVEIDFNDVEARWASMVVERDEAKNLAERLRQEAQIHSGEARAHKATVQECYRSVTGATGEPATWNGAKPVERVVAAAVDMAEVASTLIGVALDEGELKPEALNILQDALDTFSAVRHGAYYPITDVERRAVAMSKAKPDSLVVIVNHKGALLSYYRNQIVTDSELAKQGNYIVAKFSNGTLVKE